MDALLQAEILHKRIHCAKRKGRLNSFTVGAHIYRLKILLGYKKRGFGKHMCERTAIWFWPSTLIPGFLLRYNGFGKHAFCILGIDLLYLYVPFRRQSRRRGEYFTSSPSWTRGVQSFAKLNSNHRHVFLRRKLESKPPCSTQVVYFFWMKGQIQHSKLKFIVPTSTPAIS